MNESKADLRTFFLIGCAQSAFAQVFPYVGVILPRVESEMGDMLLTVKEVCACSGCPSEVRRLSGWLQEECIVSLSWG